MMWWLNLIRRIGFMLVLYWLRYRMGPEELMVVRSLVIQMNDDKTLQRNGREKRDFVELSATRQFPNLRKRDVDLAVQMQLEDIDR